MSGGGEEVVVEEVFINIQKSEQINWNGIFNGVQSFFSQEKVINLSQGVRIILILCVLYLIRVLLGVWRRRYLDYSKSTDSYKDTYDDDED